VGNLIEPSVLKAKESIHYPAFEDVVWDNVMIDASGKQKIVALFELFGIKWAIDFDMVDGNRLYKILHYKTAMDVGCTANSQQLPLLIESFYERLVAKNLTKTKIELFLDEYKIVNNE
jgi:hypothetical protein